MIQDEPETPALKRLRESTPEDVGPGLEGTYYTEGGTGPDWRGPLGTAADVDALLKRMGISSISLPTDDLEPWDLVMRNHENTQAACRRFAYAYKLSELGDRWHDAEAIIGVKRPSISQALNGHRVPGIEAMVKLANFISVDPRWLIDGVQFDHKEATGNESTIGMINAFIGPVQLRDFAEAANLSGNIRTIVTRYCNDRSQVHPDDEPDYRADPSHGPWLDKFIEAVSDYAGLRYYFGFDGDRDIAKRSHEAMAGALNIQGISYLSSFPFIFQKYWMRKRTPSTLQVVLNSDDLTWMGSVLHAYQFCWDSFWPARASDPNDPSREGERERILRVALELERAVWGGIRKDRMTESDQKLVEKMAQIGIEKWFIKDHGVKLRENQMQNPPQEGQRFRLMPCDKDGLVIVPDYLRSPPGADFAD